MNKTAAIDALRPVHNPMADTPSTTSNWKAASLFGAVLERTRQQESARSFPVVGLAMRVSDGHRNLVTEGLVKAFENAAAPGTETEKYVKGLERMDDVGRQASQLGTLAFATKIVVRNIESLTTKMS